MKCKVCSHIKGTKLRRVFNYIEAPLCHLCFTLEAYKFITNEKEDFKRLAGQISYSHNELLTLMVKLVGKVKDLEIKLEKVNKI